MAVLTFNETPRNIGTNGFTFTARNLPAPLESIQAQLNSTAWFTTTGTLNWRLEGLINSVWTTLEDNTLAIGSSFRNDGVTIPSIGAAGGDLNLATQIRVFISSTVTIRIGADITVVTTA